MNRRSFGRAAAAATAVSLTAGSAAAPQAADSRPVQDAERLLTMLQAKFPDRLDEAQWTQVRRKIEGQIGAAKALGDFKLRNADEPATVFVPHRPG